MDIRKKWTIQLKNEIDGLRNRAFPTIDPYDRNALYIPDYWGTITHAIRFRKLSLETGEELASVVTRKRVCSFCVNREYIFAVLERSRRILKLNRDNLHIEAVYRKNLPEDVDYISLGDDRTLLMMNDDALFIKWQGYFYCYDMVKMKKTKKKIGGHCCGIEKVDEDTFLLLNCDSVFQYSIKTNTVEKLFDTERYGLPYVKGESGRLYLLCYKAAQKADGEGNVIPYSSRLLVYPPTMEDNPLEMVPGILFNFLWISKDERLLYCYYLSNSWNVREDIQNTLWVYSIPEGRVLFQHTFDSGYVINAFVDEGIVLTYDWNKKDGYQLTCWEIVT